MKSEEVRGKRKMQIYVDGNAVRSGNGQKEYPFQTISEAAKIAMPGDEVLVALGVYREYVDPANAGCEDARIVYRSVEPGKAVITGAEIVDNWCGQRAFRTDCLGITIHIRHWSAVTGLSHPTRHTPEKCI